MFRLADQLIHQARKDQLAETARLLDLNLAHYQLRFSELPLANVGKLTEAQTMYEKTARLVAVVMEDLIGVLGLVTTHDEAAHGQKH